MEKIRSTQCFWIMSKTHTDFQKKNMHVIIIPKNPVEKINDEAYNLVDITSLKTLDEKTLTRQNSYKETSVI
jgi:hypothetical protein